MSTKLSQLISGNLLAIFWSFMLSGLLKGSTKARDGYEMKEVIKWFASVADSIMLVWDAQVWRMSDSLIELFRVRKRF